MSGQTVNVFPILSGAFGFPDNWFQTYAPILIHPAYLLMALLLVISVGMMVLKRFDDNTLEKKLWNIPIIITILMFWPPIVLGLKHFIDVFNTFLIRDVFHIPWEGFGFQSLNLSAGIFGWTAKAIISLLPTLSYWVVYAFYIVFFFFYAALGPFVLAKGILFDEIEAFLELMKEITLLFLWQTTLAILIAFIMPEIVSGNPFSSMADTKPNMLFLSIVLSVVILFVPTITRKFGNHLGSSFFPFFIRGGAMMLATAAIGKAFSAAGVSEMKVNQWKGRSHKFLTTLEFQKRRRHQLELEDLEEENHRVENLLSEFHKKEEEQSEESTEDRSDDLIRLSKRAKSELRRNQRVYESNDETE